MLLVFICPGLRASSLSGRAACIHLPWAKSFCPLPFRYAPVTVGSGRAACIHLPWAKSFCPLPLLYPSGSDFQFPSAGDRWFRACCLLATCRNCCLWNSGIRCCCPLTSRTSGGSDNFFNFYDFFNSYNFYNLTSVTEKM